MNVLPHASKRRGHCQIQLYISYIQILLLYVISNHLLILKRLSFSCRNLGDGDISLIYSRAVRNIPKRLEARATKRKIKTPKRKESKHEHTEIMGHHSSIALQASDPPGCHVRFTDRSVLESTSGSKIHALVQHIFRSCAKHLQRMPNTLAKHAPNKSESPCLYSEIV